MSERTPYPERLIGRAVNVQPLLDALDIQEAAAARALGIGP
ncbi:hypothetical protein [Streptomyces sp. NPDC001792]